MNLEVSVALRTRKSDEYIDAALSFVRDRAHAVARINGVFPRWYAEVTEMDAMDGRGAAEGAPYRGVILFGGYVVAALVLALVARDQALWLLAKEGPSEHLSHAVLLAACAAWAAQYVRARRESPSRPVLAMAIFLALIFMEEIDWGAVYGVPPLAIGLQQVFGNTNMHNALSGASYMLFALPVISYFCLPFWKRPFVARILEELGACASRRGDRLVFAAIALSSPLLSLALPRVWERALDELYELALYVLMLVIAVRALRLRARTA